MLDVLSNVPILSFDNDTITLNRKTFDISTKVSI